MLKNALELYQPTSPEEEFFKRQMLCLLQYNPQSFERSCTPGHFTASALILSKCRQKILLLKHRKLKLWLQPGGHCDGEQNTLIVALKEVQEETGLRNCKIIKKGIFDLDMHMIPPYQDQKAHYHFDIRYILENQDEDCAVRANNESDDIRWFNIYSELPTKDQSVLKMLKKAFELEIVQSKSEWTMTNILS